MQLSFLENLELQLGNVQVNFFSPLWIFRCLVKWPAVLNRLSHILHWNFRFLNWFGLEMNREVKNPLSLLFVGRSKFKSFGSVFNNFNFNGRKSKTLVSSSKLMGWFIM